MHTGHPVVVSVEWRRGVIGFQKAPHSGELCASAKTLRARRAACLVLLPLIGSRGSVLWSVWVTPPEAVEFSASLLRRYPSPVVKPHRLVHRTALSTARGAWGLRCRTPTTWGDGLLARFAAGRER